MGKVDTPISRLVDSMGTVRGDVVMSMLANENERFIDALEDTVRKRRADYARSLSAGKLDFYEVLDHIKEREEDFLEEYNDTPIPEPLLRAEAQDLLMEHIHQKLESKGLI